MIEKIKLRLRANKYKTKTDKGGIKYILKSITNGQIVFDMGAHKGGYLYFISKQVGNNGKVYAFEPQQTLYNYLTRMKTLFNWNNVNLEHLALSDKQQKVTLFIPENKHGSSSPGATLVPHPERNDFHTEDVMTDTLDNYCKRNNLKPDFLKIDVEGNELNIFKGGIETLKQYKPKILVECEERHIGKEKVLATFQFLLDLGYKGYFIKDADYFPLKEFDFSIHQDTSKKPYCNNFIFE